mmetsp:Transcript_45573/g.105158  ORF Transcript_45573/g.105158 Transcript_45573/m.105158 type:complete len:147 (+) Transcript_45573:146-586(+)
MAAYSHVLCDQVQDSNAARQAMLAILIRARPHANGGRGAKLVAVGDSMQAIFGFAGADTSALDSIEMILAVPPLQTEPSRGEKEKAGKEEGYLKRRIHSKRKYSKRRTRRVVAAGAAAGRRSPRPLPAFPGWRTKYSGAAAAGGAL